MASTDGLRTKENVMSLLSKITKMPPLTLNVTSMSGYAAVGKLELTEVYYLGWFKP